MEVETLKSFPLNGPPGSDFVPSGTNQPRGGQGKGDLYSRLKSLERQLEFLEIRVGRDVTRRQITRPRPDSDSELVGRRLEFDHEVLAHSPRTRVVSPPFSHHSQEEYLKEEQKNLKNELLRASEEVKRIRAVPIVIGQFLEMVDEHHGVVSSTTGSNYYVRILSTINRELLKPSASVALHRHSNALVDVLPPEADSTIHAMGETERPTVTYQDIGGLDMQKQEIREAVELPLEQADLYEQIGIDPPRGVLLYGPPGTGKTMLAKAVANATTSTFLSASGSSFVQKYLGEGPRLVRSLFQTAKEQAPSIIFIDEVDSIATARFDAQTGADREVQRILMELLTQMDGFDQSTNVKVIMATNRADTLDPALLRPGRLDRKIEFPLPTRREKRLVFQACTAKMNLSDEVDLEDYVQRPAKINNAEIRSICDQAGVFAVRNNRYLILPKDLEEAYKTVVRKAGDSFEFYT